MITFPLQMFMVVVTSMQEVTAGCSFSVGNTFQNCIKAHKKFEHTSCDDADNPYDEFRSHDGTCNNKHFKWLGSSGTRFSKALFTMYMQDDDHPDGIPCHQPAFKRVPTAHEVSRQLFTITTNKVKNSKGLSALFMAFGQFLNHDFNLTPEEEPCKISTCANDNTAYQYPCYPIKFEYEKSQCTNFTRNIPACKDGVTKTREPVNMATSYIDGSQIYGRNEATSRRLRTLRGDGKLKLTSNGLLPIDDEACVGCSLVGDERGDNNMILNSMHTLWVREHNRIAENLQRVNPHWTDDEIYNTTRKIVGGLMQKIVFKEWLPNVATLPTYTGYRSRDASILIEFSTAAFRFGHSLIPNAFSQVDSGFNKVREDVLMQEAFFNKEYTRKHGIESTLFGLCANQSNEVNKEFSEGIGRKLFIPIENKNGYEDLAAKNIQRGRDHGILRYSTLRKYLRLGVAKSFDDLKKLMPKDAVEGLKKVYKHLSDIELYPAGIVEDHVPGLAVGPTFAAIIRRQFLNLRDGDRFYYENKNVFKENQLKEINGYTMAKVMCNNLKNSVSMQKNVFKVFQTGNRRLSCNEIQDINFDLWKERPVCDIESSEHCINDRSFSCMPSSKIRRFDGTCMSTISFRWGAANTVMRRLIDPVYADGSKIPRGFPCRPKFVSKVEYVEEYGFIPTAHEVSKALFRITSGKVKNSDVMSVMFVTFGEFLSNDIVFILTGICGVRSCGNNLERDFKPPCFPLKVSREMSTTKCTPFSRSTPFCQHRFMKYREQISQVSAAIDASQIYGSNEEHAKRLRTNDNTGRLKLNGDGLFLTDQSFEKFCVVIGGCSLAGDIRNDENMALHSLYVLFAREHNRIVKGLKAVVPWRYGDWYYETARQIVGAMLQHIVYNHYLPNIVVLSKYNGLSHQANPSIINSFATAAFRFGHSQIPNQFSQLDKNFDKLLENVPLQHAFLNTTQIKVHGIEPTMFGLIGNESGEVNMEFPEVIGRKLFISPKEHTKQDDLMARNIQRGRDHGIPTYGEWRKKCGLPELKSFDDLKEYMADSTTVDAFRSLYSHPNEIDLYAAGMSEKHESGLLVGPTFSCIFRHQFEDLRSGDRFYYKGSKLGFTQSQLAEIEKTTLAGIMCRNLKGIVSIQPDVFKAYRNGDRRVACSSLPDINFKLWKSWRHDF